MSEEQTPRTLFSEKEVGHILKRATELQEDQGPVDTVGLSLEEVRQIAAEMGVDPRHVAAAVAELEKNSTEDDRFHVLGAPISYELERVVEGKVSEEQWEEMIDAIRRSFNLVGVSGQVGRLLEWTHNSRWQQVQVRAVSRGGQTRLRIYARYPKTAALTFALPLALTVQFFVIAMESFVLPGSASLIIGLLGVVFLVMRFVFGRLVQKKKREARRLLSQLEQIVAEPLPVLATIPIVEQGAQLEGSLLAEEEEPGVTARALASRTRTS